MTSALIVLLAAAVVWWLFIRRHRTRTPDPDDVVQMLAYTLTEQQPSPLERRIRNGALREYTNDRDVSWRLIDNPAGDNR